MAVFTEPTQWGHPLGNNADVSTLPDDTGATTGVVSLQKLFQLINQTPLEAGGVAPEREDINALFKILGDSVFYAMNGGFASYNATYDYAVGRFVVYNNTLYKCIQANGASSTVVAPDSVSPLGSDYWKDIENQDSTSLIPNQLIVSPVPLTDANLHLLDGALLSGSGAYADYVSMMADLYADDPTSAIWATESDWQDSVTAYGVCGKFVYDSVANTLRLPKISGFIEGTLSATDLGKLTEAGLPNIEGTLANQVSTISAPVTSGALSYSEGSGNIASFGDNYHQGQYHFNASQSNSIYGNSNTVQPQSISVYYYIVVGTVSKTDIQIDIDNVLTDLNGKADTDLSNTSPSQAFKNNSISWGMPDYSAPVSLLGLSTYTAPSDGVFMAWANANGWREISINGLQIARYTVDSSCTVPMRKGDILTSDAGLYGSAYFFPFLGAE